MASSASPSSWCSATVDGDAAAVPEAAPPQAPGDHLFRVAIVAEGSRPAAAGLWSGDEDGLRGGAG